MHNFSYFTSVERIVSRYHMDEQLLFHVISWYIDVYLTKFTQDKLTDVRTAPHTHNIGLQLSLLGLENIMDCAAYE